MRGHIQSIDWKNLPNAVSSCRIRHDASQAKIEVLFQYKKSRRHFLLDTKHLAQIMTRAADEMFKTYDERKAMDEEDPFFALCTQRLERLGKIFDVAQDAHDQLVAEQKKPVLQRLQAA